MRRFVASLVLSLMAWSFVAPMALALTGNDAPACCRRNGKHHGEHREFQRAGGDRERWTVHNHRQRGLRERPDDLQLHVDGRDVQHGLLFRPRSHRPNHSAGNVACFAAVDRDLSLRIAAHPFYRDYYG